MNIEYFKIEGIEGDYFACERLRATLKVETCAARYKTAIAGEVNIGCWRCPVGAKHCGEEIKPRSIGESKLCARCLEYSQRIVHNRLCVTCYNRTREVLVGKNAKGTKPRDLQIYPEQVRVMRDGTWRVVRINNTSKFTETVVSAARQEPGATFAWSSSYITQIHEGATSCKATCSAAANQPDSTS